MIERILELLQQHNLSAKQLTDELELSNSAITDWKKGKARPSTEAVIKLATYFDVSTDYILTGIEHSTTNQSKFWEAYSKADPGIRQAVNKLLDL